MSVNFPVFKIVDWFISLEKLDKSHLSKNPYACHLLEKNQEWIDWNELSANPNAMELLMMNKNKINWDKFNENTNPEAIAFLKKNPSKRRWVILSQNTEALEIINENIHNANWTMLSMNSNAIEILKENEDKLRFTIAANKNPQALPLIQRFYEKLLKEGSSLGMFFLYLSSNPIATDLILANIQEMNCGGLCENTSDIILNYLKENPDLIVWHILVSNPNPIAIQMIKENKNNLNNYNWSFFLKNPAIFEYDYKTMKDNNQAIEEDLIKEVLKPSRVFKYYQEGNESNEGNSYDYLEELFGD